MHAPAIAIGYLLDRFFKDPVAPWHPVRLIGRFIALQERIYRALLPDLAGGALLALATPGAVFLAALCLLKVLADIHWGLAVVADGLLVWFAISPGALQQEAKAIELLLAAGKPEDAKKSLAMIVGRDTAAMDEESIARATVETVGENCVDGLIAPLCYAALGGGPLAMAYRAVNTCDSMVGYRNARYERFGKASARLDDMLTFIPARLAIVLIGASAIIARLDWRAAVIMGLRDRLKHPSPNSAHGEAAFAGALRVRLGGPSYYGGVLKEKPWLGDPLLPMNGKIIANACRLLATTAFVSALAAISVALWL